MGTEFLENKRIGKLPRASLIAIQLRKKDWEQIIRVIFRKRNSLGTVSQFSHSLDLNAKLKAVNKDARS